MRTNHPAIPFLGGFLLLVAGFYVFASSALYQSVVLPRWIAVQAWAAGTLLQAFEPGLQVRGSLLTSPRYAVSVAQGCDAGAPIAVYVSACLAFPVAWSSRAAAVAVGFGALAVVNVVRIASLYLIGLHAPTWFHSAHVDIWPVAILAVAGVMFVTWIRRAQA